MPADDKIRKIKATAHALRTAAVHGANAYANGNVNGGERPIVDQHFTAGNQVRYGWAPLTRQYFLAKQRGIASNIKRGTYFPGKGKTGSKLDKGAQFLEAIGSAVGVGVNAPMLVLSGDLRAAVSSGKGANRHPVHATPNGAVVTFRNLPEYAIFLHTGDGMPIRSPVDPNELDRAQVVAAMSRYVDAAGGTGGAVPVSRTTIPGRARFV